jgi:hypothetical protein
MTFSVNRDAQLANALARAWMIASGSLSDILVGLHDVSSTPESGRLSVARECRLWGDFVAKAGDFGRGTSAAAS